MADSDVKVILKDTDYYRDVLDPQNAINPVDPHAKKSLSHQVAITLLALHQKSCYEMMLKLRIEPNELEPLFPILPPEQLVEAIQASLSVICLFIPKGLAFLLTKLSREQSTEAILATNSQGENSVLHVCLHAPDTLELILASLSPDRVAEAILALNNLGTNALMAVCRHAPTKVQLLLEKLSPEQTNTAIQANVKGWNALMLACYNAPDDRRTSVGKIIL